MKRIAGLAVVIALLAGVGHAAAAGRYALPPEITYPEGLTFSAKAGAFYVAANDGSAIAKVDVKTGKAAVTPTPAVAADLKGVKPGILGVRLDPKGRLWLAGGRSGKVYVVDPATGKLIQTITPPDAAKGLVNDIAFVGGRAYFNDTLRPTLWSVEAGETLAATPDAWMSFDGTALQYAPGANLNGLRVIADGKRILAVQMNKGLIYVIDPTAKTVEPVALGAETVAGADGLVLDGQTLYVIRQPDPEVVTIKLAADGKTGQVVGRHKSPSLLWPANGEVVGGELLVVNSQFSRRDAANPELPFSIQRLPLSALLKD